MLLQPANPSHSCSAGSTRRWSHSAQQLVRLHSEPTPDPHQGMELRTWRSLPEFIEKCDFLALPPAGTAGASSAAHTAEAHANSSTPGTWPAEQRMPPASIAELLGFDDATGAEGIQKLEAAAVAGEPVPGAARRNESHIVAALHQLTDVTQAGQAVAGHDLHCWACTQSNGTEALRACRSLNRAGKEPHIGARCADVGCGLLSGVFGASDLQSLVCVTCALGFSPDSAGVLVISTSDREDLVMSEANKRGYAARRAACGRHWQA